MTAPGYKDVRKHELLKMDGEKTYAHHGQVVDEYHKRGDDD